MFFCLHKRGVMYGNIHNTPGTAGGPGARDRTLAIKSRKTVEKKTPFFFKKIKFPQIFFLHISSRYAKILGEKLFRTWEIPRSGSKAKDGGKKKKKRLNDGNNNGQLRIATPPRVAHTKPAGPKKLVFPKILALLEYVFKINIFFR